MAAAARTWAISILAAALSAAPTISWAIPGPDVNFDPIDKSVVQSIDWARFEQSPLWASSGPAGADDQPLGLFPYQTARKGQIQFAGGKTEVSLRVARDGSGRHMMQLSLQARIDPCQPVRAQLTEVYGPPVATRQSAFTTQLNVQGGVPMTFGYDQAQWRGADSTITQVCQTITVRGMALPIMNLEIEPTAGAFLLEPLIVVTCPGMKADAKPLPADAPTSLTFDPREHWVRSTDGSVIGLVGWSEGSFTFNMPKGRSASVDRKTGAYSVTAANPADAVQGLCLRTDGKPAPF